jgi:hypothetical protein
MIRQTYSEYKAERDEATNVEPPINLRKAKEITKKAFIKTSQGLSKAVSLPGKPVNIAMIQRAPQTILSKEQAMLGKLFNQKNQMWGNGRPVRISNTLTTGNGLINTGSGDTTRRLFLP